MEEEANYSLNATISTDISISYSCNGCHCKVVTCEVKVKYTIVLVTTSFDPCVTIYIFILEVASYKNPKAAYKMAKKEQD